MYSVSVLSHSGRSPSQWVQGTQSIGIAVRFAC